MQQNRLNIQGKISWAGIFRLLFPVFICLIVSIIASVWSLKANFRANLVVAGFWLLTVLANTAWVLLALSSVVTEFYLSDQSLTYLRLARRKRTVARADIISTFIQTSWKPHLQFWHGAKVWLRDGSELFFSFRDLENACRLFDALDTFKGATEVGVCGRLVQSAIAGVLVAHALIVCLLMALVLLAVLILGVAFHPNPGVNNRLLFAGLGTVLLILCAAGFYFGVLRYWIGCVRWYALNGRTLCYKTVFSTSTRQRLVDDLDIAFCNRPSSPQAELGSWRLLRFRDGEQIKLHIGTLQNASQLFDQLQKAIVRKRLAVHKYRPAAAEHNHPSWQLVQSHLRDGELAWWIGRPVYQMLWSEMAAEVVFGLIPTSIGLVAIAAATQAVANRQFAALTLIGIGALFTTIGAWFITAPWRYRKLLRGTTYVVTSERVLILDGLTWGPRFGVRKATERVQSFTPDEAIGFEIEGRGRDIVFGGEWHRGRRGSNHWGHHGFLAADDRHAAEAALACLLSAHLMS